MIKKWLHKLFGCEPEYDSSPHQEHVERKTEEAEKAVRHANFQLEESKAIREESKIVGQTAKKVRAENHFTSRIRQSFGLGG
jgi:hypothetical protein